MHSLLRKFFRLPTSILFFLLFITFVMLHNLIYALTGVEEALFFSLALISVLISLISTLNRFLNLLTFSLSSHLSISPKKSSSLIQSLLITHTIFSWLAIILLLLAYSSIWPLLSNIPFIPPPFYTLVAFLIFPPTLFQTFILLQHKFSKISLNLVAWSAFVPAIIITAALTLTNFPLYPSAHLGLSLLSLSFFILGLSYLTFSHKLKA